MGHAAPTASSILGSGIDPALGIEVVLALLYALGSSRTVTPVRTRDDQRWRAACFYLGLLTIAAALDSPIETISLKLFWVHMSQHMLLLVVAPPLIVVARPWMRMWRALPRSWRRSLARGFGVSSRTAWLRTAGRFIGRPVPSFVLFSGVVLAWHIPVLFDATLRSGALHALEHSLFFFTAMLFWKQAIPSPPLHNDLSEPQRVAYLIGAMVVTWALAVVLALAPHPLYSSYAHSPTSTSRRA
jgi:putative membrane protein